MAQPARSRHEWTSLEGALRDAAIEPEAFEEAAVAAIGDLTPRRVEEDPAGEFTEDEARILAQGGLDLSPGRAGEPDVQLRTAARYAAMLLEARSAAEVARDLGVTPSRVRQRALERTLYGLRDDGEWRFPSWQFDASGVLIRGLSAVFPLIPRSLHPIAVHRFLSEPSPDLELNDEPVSPLAWLASGGSPEPVAAIAEML